MDKRKGKYAEKYIPKVNEGIIYINKELKSRGPNSKIGIAELGIEDDYLKRLLIDQIKKSKDLYYDDIKRTIKKRKKYPITDAKSCHEYVMS